MAKKPVRDNVEKFIRELASTQQLRSMYSRDHNLTQTAIKSLFYILDDLLFTESEITIGIVGDELAYKKEPFYEASQQIHGFIRHLKKIDALKISFMHGLTEKELAEFIEILSLNEETLEATGGIAEHLKVSSIKNIAFGKIGRGKHEDLSGGDADAIQAAQGVFHGGEDILGEVSDNIFGNKKIDLASVRTFVGGIINNLMANSSSLLALTAVKSHDEYSFVHNINVSIFSLLQAETLGIEQPYLNEIGVAALLHDVGKLSIPGEVLRKKGALTEEEFNVIKLHAASGAKILLESPDISPLAAIVAFGHHMRYDMSGYPEKIIGDKIDFATMIVTIADVYDALRSKRAYAGEMAPEKTYDEMQTLSGKHFQPDLLRNFFNIIGVYPPGTLVALDTGEVGLVIKESTLDIWRPQVEMLYDVAGEVKKTKIISLIEKDVESGDYKRSILHSIIPSGKFKVPEKYQFD